MTPTPLDDLHALSRYATLAHAHGLIDPAGLVAIASAVIRLTQALTPPPPTEEPPCETATAPNS